MTKILLIEDELMIRDTLKKILELKGYFCLTASSGAQGLEIIENLNPDLVICDIMIEDMDGFEVVSKMRSSLKNYFTPFIFLTARSDSADRQKGMNLGADDYLVKPVAIKDLIETVEKRLQISKERSLQKQALASKDAIDYFFNLSMHHYLNPLNGIINTAEILMHEHTMKKLNEDEKLLLQSLKKSGLTMLKWSKKLFWYVQLVEKRTCPWMIDDGIVISPEEVLQSVIEERQLSPYNDYFVQINDTVNLLYGYEAGTFRFMIAEIIDNAIRYRKENSAIKIILEKYEETVVLKVENATQNETVLTNADIKPFIHIDDNLDANGVGLGLFLAKSWINFYGGSIDIVCTNQHFVLSLKFQEHIQHKAD